MSYTIVNSKLQINGIAVALIAKGANMAIQEASEGWYLNNKEAMEWPLRLAFIREPFDRFCSAYSFFSQCYWQKTGYIEEVCEAAAKNYYEFVNYALENADEHWMPQSNSLLLDGRYTPTHTIKFEKLREIFPKFSTSTLKVINSSIRLPVCPDYRRSELEKMFGNDRELYDNALEHFDGR